MHAKYKSRGLVVVGFASNDFNQETKDEDKSAEICFLNNGVTFTVHGCTRTSRVPDANPVFKELNKQSSEPKWNFNKYLVTADGKVAKYFPQQRHARIRRIHCGDRKAAEVDDSFPAGALRRPGSHAQLLSMGLPSWATSRSCMSLACSSSTERMDSSMRRVPGSLSPKWRISSR